MIHGWPLGYPFAIECQVAGRVLGQKCPDELRGLDLHGHPDDVVARGRAAANRVVRHAGCSVGRGGFVGADFLSFCSADQCARLSHRNLDATTDRSSNPTFHTDPIGTQSPWVPEDRNRRRRNWSIRSG